METYNFGLLLVTWIAFVLLFGIVYYFIFYIYVLLSKSITDLHNRCKEHRVMLFMLKDRITTLTKMVNDVSKILHSISVNERKKEKEK